MSGGPGAAVATATWAKGDISRGWAAGTIGEGRVSTAVLESEAPSCLGVRHRARGEALAPGHGRVAVALVDGSSAVVGCHAHSPLRVFTPRPRGRAVWTVVATLGGGLVAGDAVDLAVEIGRGATALVATQSEAKIYRSAPRWTSHRVHARVAADATLAILPEPTSCFAGARYRQEQHVDLHRDGNLLLVDWVVAGRAARDERWAFDAYLARNTVAIDDRLVLADAVRLVRGDGLPPDAVMAGVALLATVLVVGPRLASDARAILDEVAAMPADPAAGVLVTASPLAGGVYLRLASRTVEDGVMFIRRRLAFCRGLVGDDPFLRRP